MRRIRAKGGTVVARYINGTWHFEIELPADWKQPGFFHRVLSGGSSNPELYGPGRSSIKFAIGSIYPVPSPKTQQSNLALIAHRHGHDVIELGAIVVGRKEHATMLCSIPGVGMVKNYSLIFKQTEYLVTARGEISMLDRIVQSFRRTV